VAAAAEAAGRRWFQGITACRRLLGPPQKDIQNVKRNKIDN
jgi:hypothetical protein